MSVHAHALHVFSSLCVSSNRLSLIFLSFPPTHNLHPKSSTIYHPPSALVSARCFTLAPCALPASSFCHSLLPMRADRQSMPAYRAREELPSACGIHSSPLGSTAAMRAWAGSGRASNVEEGTGAGRGGGGRGGAFMVGGREAQRHGRELGRPVCGGDEIVVSNF